MKHYFEGFRGQHVREAKDFKLLSSECGIEPLFEQNCGYWSLFAWKTIIIGHKCMKITNINKNI
jgi:hypothetical protein